ncbi:hypothetical protein [Paenibacillus sp. GCM10023250]|uniref:hypothetical protein n=1 Tax=Paenibacillus sp. GCM10023250 TaxID=3252648 RepID=UPI0036136669
MKFKIPFLIVSILIVVIAAVLFIQHQSNRTQIITDPAKMQSCDDTGIFQTLSGISTKAWGFGTSGNMMFTGSVVCIYNSFGKPTISSIAITKNKREARIYVQTDHRILNQARVAVILPHINTVQVVDSETKSSFNIYPDAFGD